MGRRRALALGSRGVLQICAKYPNLAQPRRAGAVRPLRGPLNMYLAKFAPPHVAQRSGTGGYVRGARQVFALGPVAPGGPRAGTLRRPWV